jgi:hypothetical protein
MQFKLTPPVKFYGQISQFRSYDLRKHKKNIDIAVGNLNRFNQFNGTIAEHWQPEHELSAERSGTNPDWA